MTQITEKSQALTRYLETLNGAPDPGAIAYYSSLDQVGSVSPKIATSIANELRDQRGYLKMIASENYSSLPTQAAMGNLLTDKYAEGVPGHRFYAGCDNVDAIEAETAEVAKKLFDADHAYVQPHSGADANLVAFLAILASRVEKPLLEQLGEPNAVKATEDQWQKVREAMTGQRLLALDYYSGGHLTHGYRFNISSFLFKANHYAVSRETGLLDLDAIREQARELKPLILLAGYSAYPRSINFAKLREIADEVGATLMVDMAHFSGLVAGKWFTGDENPVAHAHIVTSTTHKTLRGPRGGIVLCCDELAEWVDKGCPHVLGGPLPHVMAAKGVAFTEALKPDFQDYTRRVVENARYLAEEFQKNGLEVVTGGTDNHIVLVDVAKSLGLTGRQAESALIECSITLNRNSLPFDPNGAWYTSGLRFGSPALTTLGMGQEEMAQIAAIVADCLKNVKPATVESGPNAGKTSKAKFTLDQGVKANLQARVKELLSNFKLYPQIDLDVIQQADWYAAD